MEKKNKCDYERFIVYCHYEKDFKFASQCWPCAECYPCVGCQKPRCVFERDHNSKVVE